MADNFSAFAKIVAASFQDLVKGPAFVVGLDRDALWAGYLGAFPDGANPLFRKSTEHDCRCCRHFIRRAGSVVAISAAGELRTIWDSASEKAEEPYRAVATALQQLVRASSVCDIFRVSQKDTSFGTALSHSLDKESGKALAWQHFHTGEIPHNLRVASPDAARGEYRTTVQVFVRGLVELTPDAVQTVLSLIERNDLYRGEEHKWAVVEFQKAQHTFMSLPEGVPGALPVGGRERSLFAWKNADRPAARFRNTVIGTLVQELSEGKDIEHAVAAFESKVAPQNYKRTTSLITPAMVKKAMETIESLGLESALERRFAVIGDVSVNDVKWVDGTVKPLMKGGIGEVLMQHAAASSPGTTEQDEKRAEKIGLDEFVAKVLPETSSLELLFKGEHVGNLMSLTAPCHPEPKQLFRWGNDFAWSYGGNVADSIKERVKKAGGKVEGAILRVSLSWFNYDDLDLHIHEPAGRGTRVLGHIFFGYKRGWTGGTLDVDMNAGAGRTRQAVENVTWSVKPPDGAYRVVVNNYCQRETSDPGFVIEIESGGKLSHYTYNKGVRNLQDVTVVTLHMKDGLIERVETGDPAITASNISQDKWGLKTEQYVKVSAVTLSPNYWGGSAVGNKHTFFVIEGCKNNEPTRGFYNEFLHPRLEPHRKVFEVIGDKTKCQPSPDGAQLSGLGFSSTKKESFIVRARQGNKQRVLHVHVG